MEIVLIIVLILFFYEFQYRLYAKYCFKNLSLEFKFEDEAIFNRHSIQHGRYFPSKISFADFIRLVNLCSTFSEFNTIYETEDNGILL